MTAGSRSIPTMRPNHCWTILHVSILAVLLLTLNVESGDPDCISRIKVRRHTVYEASLGKYLRIDCPVVFCNNSTPTVSWHKFEKTTVPVNVSSSSHIKTGWENSNHFEGISYLIFQKILRSDAGEYQCRSGGQIGHTINVSINDDGMHVNVTPQTVTNSTVDFELTDDLWMYVYPAAGIVAFVVIVIIVSVALMHGCKGKSKKEMQTDNQYMAIPMVDRPRLQASPRGSPSVAPSQRSTRRKTRPSQPNELPLPGDNENLHGKIEEDRERPRNRAEEEGSSVVYAALNHQVPPGAAARPRRQMEETSEYAAIRVKDY